jgi:hypothetical protein
MQRQQFVLRVFRRERFHKLLRSRGREQDKLLMMLTAT